LTDAVGEAAPVDLACVEETATSDEGLQPAVRSPTPAAIEIERTNIVFTAPKIANLQQEFFEPSQESAGFGNAFRDQSRVRAGQRSGAQLRTF
jgi:hypothetical protein